MLVKQHIPEDTCCDMVLQMYGFNCYVFTVTNDVHKYKAISKHRNT